MNDFNYQHWLTVASRYSRRKSESADLLHDALLDAIRADRVDFSLDATRRWFAGVIKNRAAMTARSAIRRRQRETILRDKDTESRIAPNSSFLESLSPAAKSVAMLIVAGLNRDEIVAALKIAPTAFRQRLTSIRRSWMRLPADQREGDESIASDLPDLGLMRRALLSHVRRVGGIGTHDPDGHLISISELARSQSPARRQQNFKKEKK